MLRILVIDSDPAEQNAQIIRETARTTGQNYAAVLQDLCADVQTTVIAPYDGDPIPDLRDVHGAVFTGSGVSWNTDDARAEPLRVVMRAVFGQGVPTLGSCNGMQLAASVLGGASDSSPNGREDGMARAIRLTDVGKVHPMLAGRRDGYAVPCVHRDEVIALPEGAALLATNAHSNVQAFAYERDGVSFWGMQYHPECTPAFIGAYTGASGKISAEMAADMARAETDEDAAHRLGTTPHEQQTAGRTVEIRNWLAHVAALNEIEDHAAVT